MKNKLTNLRPQNNWLALLLVTAMIAVLALPASMVSAVGTNLALNKPAVSSSIEGAGFEAGKAVDGNATSTRWASVEPAPNAEWIYVDLGSTTAVGEVILKWEAAYGKSYQVQTSNDAVNWTTIYTTTTGDGATDDLVISGNGRYVRVYMTVRGTVYGYSLWELEVYGTGGATATNTSVAPTATRTNTPIGPTATRTNTSVPPTATNTAVASGDLALNKTATASSVEANTSFVAANAVDGNANTRWGSVDPATTAQWIYVDLGATSTIARVVLSWEAAYATSYQVQTSNDATNWTNIYSTTTGNGAIDDLTGLSGSGRYVRVYMTVRGSVYGYSLWSFEVYGTGGATATNTAVGPTATRTNTPVGPTATRTNTPVPPTATRTNTPAPTATNSSTCQANGSVWSGHNWSISNGGMAGIINANPANVWTDSNCYLHLRVVNNGGTWTGGELFTTDKVGFGTYQWQIEGNNIDYMDKAIVLGLYPYGRAANIGADGENEIDIELSRWDDKDCPPCNGDFTVYPSTGNFNLGQSAYLFNPPFDLPAGNQQVTGRFVWSSTRIDFYLMTGFLDINASPTNIIESWSFAPTNYTKSIPQVALPFGMNLWAYNSLPSAGQEVIIRNFQYKP